MKFLLVAFLTLNLYAETLNIMSWNIFMIPKPFNFTMQYERSLLIAEKLQQISSDIFVLEESFTNFSRKQIIKSLIQKYPYYTVLKTSGKFYQFLNSGVFVISRYPFQTLSEVFYDECNGTDCFASKGFLLIELTLPSQRKVQIGMTHLQAWDAVKNVNTRIAQLKQIRDTMDKFKVEGVPQLLVGDFNIAYTGPERKNLENILNVRPQVAENSDFTIGFEIPCYFKPGDNTHAWIDYIMARGPNTGVKSIQLEVRKIESFLDDDLCNLSDHYTLQGKLEL